MIFDGHSDLFYDVTKKSLGRSGGRRTAYWNGVTGRSCGKDASAGWDCPCGSRRSQILSGRRIRAGTAGGGREEMMACFQAELADSPWLVPVRTAAEAREVQAAGKTFAFLAVEGMEPVGNRLERLEQYARGKPGSGC